ncbi:MAG: hypothetical protein Q7U63_02735 [Polaromonas sp.]|uniref:hypothetical protein n=1 Tax=Polaromonas sp. TaxID=1869339 RepID=UPI00271A7AE1|nr:hypothetical protein [Polaromonas sp.]MDO9112690.1 hypothetical protein [Polaromonas sp.]
MLRWAPGWDCSHDSVLFDARSGDYWLLSSDGRTVIEWLLAQPAIAREELLGRLAATTAEGEELLGNLAAAGLLTGVIDGMPAHLPPGLDSDQ